MSSIRETKHGRQNRTGIFLPHFDGLRLKDFPQALDGILDHENVLYYDGVYRSAVNDYYMKPVPDELLFKVHTKKMIERVKRTGYFEAALYSAGGSVQAADEIRRGHIDDAFVFTGHGDHHAGRDFFGGMCYLNGAALAIADLRSNGLNRFVIVDTDSHHGDGTRAIFARDKDVLHICFCYQNYEDEYNNVDVAVPCMTDDESYLREFRQAFVHRVHNFKPEMIIWEYGYDATQGEYGDKGLSKDCHMKIVKIIKAEADRVCNGRLVAILCGGSSRLVATYTIPRIIRHLAGLDSLP
jgi:acetoin utilization deacetylase AcuC-like enzyme